MPIDYKRGIHKLIYESIRYVDVWMGYTLDDDHHMLIRKRGFQYHINLYHNDNLVDERTLTYPHNSNRSARLTLLLNMMNMCFKILKWWLICVGIWYYMKNYWLYRYIRDRWNDVDS